MNSGFYFYPLHFWMCTINLSKFNEKLDSLSSCHLLNKHQLCVYCCVYRHWDIGNFFLLCLGKCSKDVPSICVKVGIAQMMNKINHILCMICTHWMIKLSVSLFLELIAPQKPLHCHPWREEIYKKTTFDGRFTKGCESGTGH